ncbi:MAG: hypothetical protein HQL26_08680 [Candidatus Omnitrophica bacterium]|nr:hypothetical protein [Candidatus Omnitrophota bacterium]
MAGKNNETAEQKLLKMIETSSGSGAVSSKAQQDVKQKQNLLIMIRCVNGLLVLLIVLGIALIFGQFRAGNEMVKRAVAFTEPKIAAPKISGLLAKNNSKNLDVYISNIHKRNFFYPYEKPHATGSAEVSANRDIARATKSLRLVGVSWLDSVDSASVMIEDTEKNQTYFLMKGEKIGDIFVKTIYADSVELGYQNEEIVIKYDTPKP